VNPDPQATSPRRRGVLIAAISAGALVLVGATVAITLAATRTPATTPAARQTQAPPAATTATSTPAAAAASAASQAPAVLKFGAKADGQKMTSTAYAYKQPVAQKAPPPDQDGFEWGAADVEVCAKGTGYLNNGAWVLVYADHTRIQPSSIGYQQFPEPEYPSGDTDVTIGQCIRGWITYPVPTGKRPVAVHYQPQGFQADWQVS
jgi:hypothetical protein